MSDGNGDVASGWREGFVESAGGRVHVSTAGSGDALVILPDDIGVPGWLPLHEALAARYSLYLLCHPGFGRSDRPDWARNVRDLAALEGDVLRKLGLVRPAVLGLGFGGWLAAELATQCGPCFSRMVLVAPFGLQPEEGEIFDQFLGRGPRYARAGFADTGCYEATYGPEPDIDTLENWEINREMTARVAWSPYLFNQALPHLLPVIDIPTLVLWGEEDAIIPATEAGRWARLIPRAECRLLPRCGHRADIEQPEAVAAAVAGFVGRS